MQSNDEVIIISGKDVFVEVGGHGSYVQAMGMAARGAGFTPEIFCASHDGGTRETPFGRMHLVRSPLRFVTRHGPGEGLRTRFLPFHFRPIRRQIEEYLHGRTGAFIVHGVGPWGSIGVSVARRMQSPDRRIVPITTVWSTMQHEHGAKLAGATMKLGFTAWLRARIEYLWFKLTIFPLDHHGIRRSSRVFVNYESAADQLRDLGIPESSIDVVPYATHVAFGDPLALRPEPEGLRRLEPREAPMIVALSRHDSRKGLDVFLEALALLRDRGIGFRACLVGPGPLLEVHRRMASRLGLDGSVEIVGFAEDPVAYLQHSEIFVLPSIEEGCGSLSLLEALQAGLAIVASDVDGIPEDVTDGDSAVLVPVGDAAALSAGLETVLIDADLRGRLRARARQVFEERFSAPVFSASVRTLYRDLLRDAAAPE